MRKKKKRSPMPPERGRVVIGATVLAVQADTTALEEGLARATQAIHAANPPSTFRIVGASEGFEILAEDAPGAGGEKLKKFAMTAYTGAAMRLAGFPWPVVVDLEGMATPRASGPIFANHDPSKIVGHWTKAEVSAQRIKVSGVLSGAGKAAKKVSALAANGFPWQASIGADATRVEFIDRDETVQVNGRNFTGPLYVARGTVLGEVSFVPIGADGATSATVAAAKPLEDTNVNFSQWLVARGFVEKDMSDGDKKLLKAAFDAEAKLPPTPAIVAQPASAPITTDIAAQFKAEMDRLLTAGRDQLMAEQTRVSAIVKVCAADASAEIETTTLGADGKPIKANLQQHAIACGWTAEATELQLLRLQALRATRPQGPFGAGPHLHIPTTPEASEAVLECASLHALRHQFNLDSDGFYEESRPDNQGKMQRVPGKLKAEIMAGMKADYGDQVQQAAHTLFHGRLSLQQLMVLAGRQNGYKGPEIIRDQSGVETLLRAQNWALGKPGMPGRRLIAEGSSTMSISNILANVQNKFMLQGYLFVEQTWRTICGIRPVGDFKPSKSINLLGDVEFLPLGRNGEIQNASLGDQAFANQAYPYARMLTIPWTNLVDDDLSILSTAPQKVGQGAGLALNKLVWATFGNPGNGDDGNAFYTTGRTTFSNGRVAANDNSMSGGSSALSSTSLATAKKLFDNQIDPDGNPLGFDGAQPILAFPPDLWQTAMELIDPAAVGIIYGGASASRQPNVNLWKGRFQPAMSRYLNKTYTTSNGTSVTGSTTAWYILFNPMALAAIEVCFLNGVDVPTVQQAGPDYQFDRLGISLRGTMPFGVTMQNFRAAVKAAGA